MDLPIVLKNIIEEKASNINIKSIQKDAENISNKYRDELNFKNKRLKSSDEALAYSLVRMPATYGAVYTAINQTFKLYNTEIQSLLDVGAGTGAGTWAAYQFFDFEKIVCLEYEKVMQKLGQEIMNKSGIPCLENAEWKNFDLVKDSINQKADLVICSYVLNELNEENRKIAIEKLWNATNKVLIILEPGTPNGFKEIIEISNNLKENKAKIIAPCPNVNKCMLPDNDWCHSVCRVNRTKAHKLLKNAEVPYEDEKFSYIALCKEDVDKLGVCRILRHPKIESGKITLKMCTTNGIFEKIITKKDKEMFKKAKKVNCGEYIIMDE